MPLLSAPQTLTPTRRRALLDEHASLERRLREAFGEDEGRAGDLLERRRMLRREYVRGLPVRWLATCPFTGTAVLYPIDDFDLDGLWWDHAAPARDWLLRPPTLYALTGGVRPGGPIAAAPFFRDLGPPGPSVVPRLLEPDGTRAVVTSLPVGAHTAYVTLYFAPPDASNLPITDEFASGRWLLVDDAGAPGWSSNAYLHEVADRYAATDERDLDLAPWISSGRVGWLPPGEGGAAARGDLVGCPYLGLDVRASTTVLGPGAMS